MPRRKVKTITIGELADGANILEKLKSDPIFEGYDFSTLTINIKANITPKIKNAEVVAVRLESYLRANPDCCEEYLNYRYVTKQKLAESMLKVSRATLDKWIDDKLITMPYLLTRKDDKIEICDLYDVLKQLKEYIAQQE